MKVKTRFIKSVVETARQNETNMPWARGARREAMIARRQAPAAPKAALRTA